MVVSPRVSVVVCTRNRAAQLRLCLESLSLQSLSPEIFEVLVVDNGSTDDTRTVAESYQPRVPLRVLTEPVAGLSRARNRGWREARAPWVGFIDDDARAERQWLERAWRCFEEVQPRPSALCGQIELDWETEEPAWMTKELRKALSGLDLGEEPFFIQGRHTIVGANCFFLRRVLEELEGFDISLGRTGGALLSGEEVDLQRKIEARGGAVYYHPDVRVEHFVPAERASPRWFYRRYYWGGISDAVMNRARAENPGSPGRPSSDSIGAPGRTPAARVARNLWRSLAVGGSSAQTVHSRIYLAYVAGFLRGRLLPGTHLS